MNPAHRNEQFASSAARAVNAAGIQAMARWGRIDPTAAAALFSCERALVDSLIAALDARPGLEQVLCDLPAPLFSVELHEDLLLGHAYPRARLMPSSVPDVLAQVRDLNLLVLAAASRASASDACAVLSLGLGVEVADAIRCVLPARLIAVARESTAPMLKPRFGAPFLRQAVTSQGVAQASVLALAAACLANDDDVRPVHFFPPADLAAARTSGPTYGRVDLDLAMLCQSAVRLGVGRRGCDILFGSQAKAAMSDRMLREFGQSSSTSASGTSRTFTTRERNWDRNPFFLMGASAATLGLLRLIRAGFAFHEATIFSYEHYLECLAVGVHSQNRMKFRDFVLAVANPLSNRRASLALSCDYGAAHIVTVDRATSEVTHGAVPPHRALARLGELGSLTGRAMPGRRSQRSVRDMVPA